MPQNAASDQGLHCLHRISIKNKIEMKKDTKHPLNWKLTRLNPLGIFGRPIPLMTCAPDIRLGFSTRNINCRWSLYLGNQCVCLPDHHYSFLLRNVPGRFLVSGWRTGRREWAKLNILTVTQCEDIGDERQKRLLTYR